MLILENCFKIILKCQPIILVLYTASALFFLFSQPHQGKSSESHGRRAGFSDVPWETMLLFLLIYPSESCSNGKLE